MWPSKPKHTSGAHKSPGHSNAHSPRDWGKEAFVCEAIAKKLTLVFRYKPSDLQDRVFAPHVAWITEDGGACVHGYQLGSETGASENSPHNFTISKMSGLKLGASFTIDRSFDLYKRRDRVLCIVSSR